MSRVKELGAGPEDVAEELDLDVADIRHAFAYYYDHREEMGAVRKRREHDLDELRREADEQRPDGVSP